MNATDDDSPVCNASRGKKWIQIYSSQFVNRRIVQNVLQHFLYFSQNQQQMSEIFSVVNFERPACYWRAAEQYFSRACAEGRQKKAWQVDLHFKQRVVIEFLVAEKESVTYIHKRLKMYTVSMFLVTDQLNTQILVS